MYARSSTLAILAAVALTLPANHAPRFTLGTSGAVNLNVSGDEAVYGVIPTEAYHSPVLTVSLGATRSQGSIALSVKGDGPVTGRFPVTSSWSESGSYHASFVAGSPEHPLGWFQGQSGWVRITEVAPNHISGEFEIQARGFLQSKPDDENKWVTVRGRFEANGNSSVTTIASLQ